MISLYLKINLFLLAGWIGFSFLPQLNLRARSRKVLAQTLLICALIAVPLLSMFPEESFPHKASAVAVAGMGDVDAAIQTVTPLGHVLKTTVTEAKEIPARIKFSSALLIWLLMAGILAMLARRTRSWWQMAHLLRDSLSLHEIGRTSVVISDHVAVPFSVMFFFRAYVVLPSSLIPFREEFKIALKHEFEHHRRRDTLWAVWLEYLICGFYLNPAAYLWRRTVLQLQELACDEALISRMGISQQAYGSCLLRVAEMALGRRFMCAGTTCMIPTSEFNGHSFLRRRITMFATYERTGAKKVFAVALGTMSCLLVFAGAYFAEASVRSNVSGVNPGTPVFDSRIQPIAMEALKKGMSDYNASAGLAIVADPTRGTIIAAVSLNTDFDSSLKGDWALTTPIEPGSALKPLLLAAAVQRGVVKVDDVFKCDSPYVYGKNLFHDEGTAQYDRLTAGDAVVESSNICSIKFAQKLGASGIEAALKDFGIGAGGSAAEYPGARVGYVPAANSLSEPDYVAFTTLGSTARTHLQVTPLELVDAYSALANGGRLLKAIPADGSQSTDMIRDVVSSDTAAQIRDVLRRVVTEGTAEGINGSTVTMAGKTATAVVNGKRRVTGFVGFAPVDSPKVVVYVAYFDPKGPKRAGSNTAAPVFREIVEKVVPLAKW